VYDVDPIYPLIFVLILLVLVVIYLYWKVRSKRDRGTGYDDELDERLDNIAHRLEKIKEESNDISIEIDDEDR